MKLDKFEGGKNSRLDASLIAPNEAVVYTNIDNTQGILKSCKGYTLTNIDVRGYFYLFGATWLSSDNNRDYVEYQNKVYWTEDGGTPKKYDGLRITNLGIAAPTLPLDGIQSDPVGSEFISAADATLQYTYTYYNSQDQIESPPAPITTDITVALNKNCTLSGFVAPTDPQVDKIRLYRVGDTATIFTLIVELPTSTTSYVDSIPTLDAVGILLDTLNNQPALNGLKFITEAYGIFFGAIGHKVYYSIQGFPDYWPSAQFISLNADVTAIFPIQDGIVLFTNKNMTLLVGNSVETFNIQPVSTEQGCISHKSCKLVKSLPTWVSNDGVCVWYNGAPAVYSKDKLGRITLDVKNVAIFDETYYICLTNGNLLAMDLRFGTLSLLSPVSLCFKDYDFDDDIVNIGVFNNTLYAMINGKVASLFDGVDLPINYLSPELIEEYDTMTKLYNNIYVKSSGTLILTIYIDGNLVATRTLSIVGINDVKVPEEKQRGSTIQFGINGIGYVKEIEYKVQGRQNGR